MRQEQLLARNADFAQVHCGTSCGTPFETAWNGTRDGTCHVLILVMPNVLVVPDVVFVVTAAAALSAKG